MEKLNGLDLFSGIGGLTKALEEWVRPVAYCERDRYAQAVLLSRMQSGDLSVAPIWDDVQSLPADLPTEGIDIIYGGFPCQDISVAGHGKGLEGQRSSLFFEIIRLAQKIKPTFIFLENVPAIRTRGLDRVIQELTEIGYDCRWTMLSAADVGANHKRERWFLLAYTTSFRLEVDENPRGKPSRVDENKRSTIEPSCTGSYASLADSAGEQSGRIQQSGIQPNPGISSQNMADTSSESNSQENSSTGTIRSEQRPRNDDSRGNGQMPSRNDWWLLEPAVGRVVDGVPDRVDRLKGLGNAVVPQQAKEAFKILAGL